MRTKRERQEGFTLIELLLVVVIIGLLAAIVAPRLLGRSEEARVGAAKAQIKSFQNALAMYETDNGRLPTEQQGLLALLERPSAPPEPKSWKKYLDGTGLPLDPWGFEYKYRCPGELDPDGYDLWSVGPDGQDGTDDDIRKP
ncbi:MAG: type II secretion system major pseudopilin GspG [Planctomycetes bacterium]|nr:type II secretion system major pseudopilin GspG [Planctomycetota bacterium]